MECLDFRRPEIAGIDVDQGRARRKVLPSGGGDNAYLVPSPIAPFELHAHIRESRIDELLNRVALSRPYNVIVGPLLLEHQVHHLYVLGGKAPVAQGTQVAHVEFLLAYP